MRIVIFGRAGQVGRELARCRWPADWTVTFHGRPECDLTVPGMAAAAIAGSRPDIVINAAAYTAVDRAESEPEPAFRLNAEAPGEIAEAAGRIGAALIHLSTDYVFDGAGERPYRETDPCAPLSVYGRSKRAGEEAVRAALAAHLILRTSWVFSPFGGNFVKTMLRLAVERDELAVVGDQWGGPTAADDIASAILALSRGLTEGGARYGTYHFAGAPDTSWHSFAESIFVAAAAKGFRTPARVRRITAADYPTPARRPANSRLDCGAILRDWKIARPQWRNGLDRCLEALAGEGAGPS